MFHVLVPDGFDCNGSPLIFARLEINSAKALLWGLLLFICKNPQTNASFQAKSCIQSHKMLFIFCPTCSKQPIAVPFFFPSWLNSVVQNFLMPDLLSAAQHGHF